MMRGRTRMAPAWAAALLLAAGCGGGGGGGPTAPPPPPPGIVFTAGTAGANSIGLAQGAGTTATTLVLEVRINEVMSLYGLAFDLSYPTAQLSFDQASEGTLLSAGGAPTAFEVVESSPGDLVVGLSQLGTLAGISGSGVLLTLRFTASGAGSGTFTFSNNRVFSPDGSAQSGVTWQGGSVRVTL
jgi:Cohesin domain